MVLKQNTCLAQEPVSTYNATKCIVEILDAKYEKADSNHCQGQSHSPELITLQLPTCITTQIWGALWWHAWGLEAAACLLQIKGGFQAIPWQALLYPKDPQGYSHEENWLPGIDRGNEMTTIITMGLTFIHNPKKRSYGTYHLRL